MSPQFLTDSTMMHIQAFMTQPVSRETDAPSSATEKAVCSTTIVPYTNGLPGELRPTLAGENSGVITLLVATFVLVAFGFKHCSRLFSTFTQDLWSVRQRANAFDDHTTHETQVIISLLIQTCVYEGIILFSLINNITPIAGDKIFATIMGLTGVTISIYLFQLMTYCAIGYVFSDKTGFIQWIKGFNASQSLLGFTLIIPALSTIFYPSTTQLMLIISAILYVIARLVFICKGFRIFYHSLFSLLYFILYLCTAEIIPVILAYSGAVYLSSIVQ